MSAGLVYAALGHDRIAGLSGIGRALPISVLAFALGGVALIGVPPGGAYLAKELLLQAAVETDQWWWAVVIQVGGIFTSAYLVLVLIHALAPADKPVALRVPVPWYQEVATLSLALCSLLLGLVHWEAYLPVPQGTRLTLSVLETLSSALWPILAGGVLAILLGRWGDRLPRIPLRDLVKAVVVPVRRRAVAAGEVLARADSILRQWPAAGLSLLALAIVLGAAMLIGR
jgi:multicomponent Na+:H+ antiporter subunit D